MTDKKKLIISGLQGTLVSNIKPLFLTYQELILKKIKQKIIFENFISIYDKDNLGDRIFLRRLVPNINDTDIKVIQDEFQTHYQKHVHKVRLYPEVLDIIVSLSKNYYTAIVTSSPRPITEKILKHLEIENVFDLVITHNEIRNPKPSPEGFIEAMNYFNVNRQNTIILEDSHKGYNAAKTSGAKVFYVGDIQFDEQ